MKKFIFSIIVTSSLFAQSGYELIKENGCLACHAIASKKTAPAFAGIAKRNLRFYGNDAKSVIKSTIKNGSSGKYPKFSNSAMPPFSNLSNIELDRIAKYILAQANKAKGHGGGGCKGNQMGMNKGRM